MITRIPDRHFDLTSDRFVKLQNIIRNCMKPLLEMGIPDDNAEKQLQDFIKQLVHDDHRSCAL